MAYNKQKINRRRLTGLTQILEKNEFKLQGLDWNDYMIAAFTVHNKYGFGYLEKANQNFLLIESNEMGIGLLVNFEKSDEESVKLLVNLWNPWNLRLILTTSKKPLRSFAPRWDAFLIILPFASILKCVVSRLETSSRY